MNPGHICILLDPVCERITFKMLNTFAPVNMLYNAMEKNHPTALWT
jgi:hypothetical protein